MFNFVSENLAVYGMWKKNMAEPDMPQMTIWRMRIVSRKPKATNTHTQSNTYYYSTPTMAALTRLTCTL